jgi:hypothetical protein
VKNILRQLYPLKPITASHRSDLTARISGSLAEWRSNLISFLDTENFSASLFLPIVQRQRNVLNLTYWHAVILTHRPFLLNNFGESGQSRDVSDDNPPVDKSHIERSVQNLRPELVSYSLQLVHVGTSGVHRSTFQLKVTPAGGSRCGGTCHPATTKHAEMNRIKTSQGLGETRPRSDELLDGKRK